MARWLVTGGAALAIAWPVMCGAPGEARGQAATMEEPLAAGLHAGIGASRWLGTAGDSVHLGGALGAFVTYRLTPALALQVELSMLDKGAGFVDASGGDASEALLYLELPVLARFDLPLTELASLYGVAGPGAALLVDSKRTPRADLRPVDLTAAAGIGIDLYTPRHHLSFDLRATAGLLDAASSDPRSARSLLILLLAGVTLW
jgi:hypothetical protein